MIIVTGSVVAKAGMVEQLMAECLAHTRRSRTEPGCVSHAVHIDAENPGRLVFFEEWQDMPALLKHFKVPASGAFVAAVRSMVAAPPVMTMYDANQLPIAI